MWRSEPHTPVASTRTIASSRSISSGSGRSSIATSPGAWNVTACMGDARYSLAGRGRRVLLAGWRDRYAERAHARAVGPERPARRSTVGALGAGTRALRIARRHADGSHDGRDPRPGADRAAHGEIGRAHV